MHTPERDRTLLAAVLLLAAGAGAGTAGAGTASAQACTPPPRPAFEFQVERPAAYAGDTTAVPRPARQQADLRAQPEALVVQFVVDTLGAPVARSFKVLQSPSAAATDSTRAALATWRFTPAELRGCRVPQLVQTTVTH